MPRKEKRELFEQFSFLNKIYRFLLTLLFIYDFDFFCKKTFLLFAISKFENGTALETGSAKI